MRHEEIVNRLSAYLDGEVGPDEGAQIEAHLSGCRPCAAVLSQLRALSASFQRSAIAQLHADAAFLKRIHQEVDALARRGVERVAWGLSAIAACVAVVGMLQLMRPATAAPVAVVPAAWEGAAVELSRSPAEDTAASANGGDLVMAEWMVADLSEGKRTQ